VWRFTGRHRNESSTLTVAAISYFFALPSHSRPDTERAGDGRRVRREETSAYDVSKATATVSTTGAVPQMVNGRRTAAGMFKRGGAGGRVGDRHRPRFRDKE
jgi:hypothetical protein